MSKALDNLSAAAGRIIGHFAQELFLYKGVVSKDETYKTVGKTHLRREPVQFTGSLSSLSVAELDNLFSMGIRDFTSYLKLYTTATDLDINPEDLISINGCFYLVETIRAHTRAGIAYLEMIIREEAWE
ncbi:DUF1506 family protein [Borrelia sp. RT1S]|uniref:DUF1506 family protein n=1 Tax=Borrelia sp. RT1S TaxID=2898580 RepID=UPI001E64DA38|nr:DUF1506 family protein [Borrelia sp. RT1S]UGQ17913.1 DUF1506 family protein [Borrelia sp. RT1S]